MSLWIHSILLPQNQLMTTCPLSWFVLITWSFLHILPRYDQLVTRLILHDYPYTTLTIFISSGQEILCKKLLYAISEGQGSFDLSWIRKTETCVYSWHNLVKIFTCDCLMFQSGSLLFCSIYGCSSIFFLIGKVGCNFNGRSSVQTSCS